MVLLVSRFDRPSVVPGVGFIVTKKNGCAVKRNLIRRRLRSLAVKLISKFGHPSKVYIIIPRSGIISVSFSELEKDLLYCLRYVINK